MTHRTDHAGRDGCGLISASTIRHEFEILGTVPVGVLVLRADASLLYANEAAHKLFGGAAALVNIVETLCPADGSDLEERLGRGDPFEAIVTGPEMHRQVMVSVADLTGGASGDLVVGLTDVTDLKRATERAEFLAHHDPLTRLGNRTLLQSVWDVLEKRLADGLVEVHAMALDLDRFKEVNDVHGHGIGDMVLRQAANRILTVVGDAGHVFRFGGDEFFVLVDHVSRDEAVAVGRRIVQELAEPMSVLGHRLSIGCSVGIASAPMDGMRRDALHRAADLALYDVKHDGRGDVACFNPQREQALLDRRLLQADLVLAIADDGLDLVFEPQIDSRSGMIETAEASIRWINPRSGQTVPPSDLTTLAAETGLSHLLDLWTLRTAVARFAARLADGWTCPNVAVTIGTATLLRPDTAEVALRALAEHELLPHRLELQIAESSVLAAGDELTAAIRRLTETGVRIVIVGFGSDRPDLGYLRSLGIGRLKLDRKVAERMLGDADAEALIGAVWTLCHKLGIEMSADGVETVRQWDALRRLGRVRAQGSYLSGLAMADAASDRRQVDSTRA